MANHLYGYSFSYGGGGDGTPKSSAAAAISSAYTSRSLADPYLLSDSALRYDPDHSKYSSSSVYDTFRYSTASPYLSSQQPWPPGVDSTGRLTTALKRSSEGYYFILLHFLLHIYVFQFYLLPNKLNQVLVNHIY